MQKEFRGAKGVRDVENKSAFNELLLAKVVDWSLVGLGGFTTLLISDTLGRPKQSTQCARRGLVARELMKM